MLMARKPSRRRKGFRSLPIDIELAMLTTGDGVVAAVDLGGNFDEPTFCISADVTVSTRGFTATEGPIVVGMAHSDYSASEIEGALEAVTSWNLSNMIERELAARKVRTIGSLPILVAAEVMQDGKTIKLKLGFSVAAGHTLKLWAWNQSGSPLTTGGLIELQGRLSCRTQ